MSGSNNIDFIDSIFNALIFYVSNKYLEVLKLSKILDEVLCQMVKSEMIGEVRIDIESTVLSIESFLDSRDGLMPLS